MSMPFYVAPEQQMKDRADFARKGIARGRSVVVLHYADGIVFVAENRSQALHKVSEIYDRIGFAAVGRYNEFENLRTAGIRYADFRGYSYDRTDVTGRGLANAYAQLLGTIFSSGGEKPYEVEIVVAELGATSAQDQIYRLTYDGSVADEAELRGDGRLGGGDRRGRPQGLRARAEPGRRDQARRARPSVRTAGRTASPRSLGVDALEVAILDRNRRCRASSAGSPASGWRPCWRMTSSRTTPARRCRPRCRPSRPCRRPWSARARDLDADDRRRVAVVVGTGLIGASDRLRADRRRLPGAPAGPAEQPRPGGGGPGGGDRRAGRAGPCRPGRRRGAPGRDRRRGGRQPGSRSDGPP